MEQKLRDQNYVRTYKRQLKYHILTSRFNHQTWTENTNYRQINPQIGCVYGAPIKISNDVPVDSIIFMLEMNNDTNKILGIGMIKNHTINAQLEIYEKRNYSRYIDRSEMSGNEELVMLAFDVLCFRGNHHMKRGQGLLSFPVEILCKCLKVLDLVEFITNMFRIRIRK